MILKNKPYLLKGTTWKTVKTTEYEIAVLPWGATEAHNYHLPYGTDFLETDFIAEKAVELAWNNGAKVILLPSIPFGVNTQQLDIKMTINMNPSTQFAVLADIIESLENSKIKKFVVLNGHGGNSFKQMIRELQKDTDVFLSSVDWFKTVDEKRYFENDGDHGGEMETSMMIYAFPDLVLQLEEAGEGKEKRNRINAFNEGWAWAPRKWAQVTEDTGIGNPKLATVEKGEKYLNDVINKIAQFLVDLSNTDINEIYQ